MKVGPKKKAERKRPATSVPKDDPKKFKYLADVEATGLLGLGKIWLKDAMYYLRPVEVVGKITGLESDPEGRLMVNFKVSGTRDDGLLREMSGKRDRLAKVHVCPGHCPANTTGEAFLHARLYRKIEGEGEGWFTNLEVVPIEDEREDELELLRKAAALEGRTREEASPREEKKSKKEKKRKERSPEKGGKKEKEPEVELEPGQKELTVVYGGTALDPDHQVRERQLKKARKVGRSSKKKKKKKKSDGGSSSGSGSSSTSSDLDDGRGLFENERKMKLIWRKYPGSLAASAVMEARENLISSAGTLWGVEKGVPPVLTQYGRVHLLPLMGGAMSQEALTLCVSLDLLLQGKVASCADVIAQRVKALESTARGNHWQVSRQLELIRSEIQGIADEQETLQAARRAREEAKLKSMASKAPGFGGGERPYDGRGGKGKNKDAKGSGKQRADEAGKGRQDGKKDDKGGWQKK